ncbi:type II toxin-antitoxin system VapC family toxin [bacterium]|nr:type II toxin-antitoxin system VapC family toxin [bacterium]NCT20608.1 type II toxin-antitoxin system VapC family toxin [bacterium]
MANKYVLDTSAVVAMLRLESGAERVRDLIRSAEGNVILPWMVLYEIYYLTLRTAGEVEAKQRYANLRQLPLKIVWQENEETLLAAAHIKAAYPLSVADSWIAAIAEQESAILVHKDPEMEALTGKIDMEILPYK